MPSINTWSVQLRFQWCNLDVHCKVLCQALLWEHLKIIEQPSFLRIPLLNAKPFKMWRSTLYYWDFFGLPVCIGIAKLGHTGVHTQATPLCHLCTFNVLSVVYVTLNYWHYLCVWLYPSNLHPILWCVNVLLWCHALVCIYGFGVISALYLSCLAFFGFKD